MITTSSSPGRIAGSALLLGLAIAAPTAASEPRGATDSRAGSLGAVHFPVSCAPAAQAEIEHGVALLHHMTYPQAREAFARAAAADPECAMASWGQAMSRFQPLWPNRPTPQALEEGRAAAELAVDLRPPSEREQLYVATAAAFFADPEADYWQRIRRWEAAQEALYRALPEDLDAIAFYALARLATARIADRPLDHHAQAADLLWQVHAREPTHPGAVHYMIHANDIDGRAGEALEVARSYAEIAPANPHALHMPTHIFVRLGLWDEVLSGNRAAAAAALAHPAGDAHELVSDEYPHAFEYLVYAFLQQGDREAAEVAWTRLAATQDLEPTFKTAFHFASIPARIVLESRAWAEAATLEPRQPSWIEWDRFRWPEAISWFTRGLGQARLGHAPEATAALTALERLRDGAESDGETPFAREIEILRLELAAWIAAETGHPDQATSQMEAAVALQAATPKQPVTPAPTLPAQELLGDLLLELGRPGAALDAYVVSLRATPGRFNSVQGMARAERALSAALASVLEASP